MVVCSLLMYIAFQASTCVQLPLQKIPGPIFFKRPSVALCTRKIMPGNEAIREEDYSGLARLEFSSIE